MLHYAASWEARCAPEMEALDTITDIDNVCKMHSINQLVIDYGLVANRVLHYSY